MPRYVKYQREWENELIWNLLFQPCQENQSQAISTMNRQQKISELLTRQQALKADLASAKTTLMVDPDSWSFDRT